MLIDKIDVLDEQTQRIFYRDLTKGLLSYFGQDYYSSEEELQEAFHFAKNGDRRSYREFVDELLLEIAPEGVELTWRDLHRINYRRWRLCVNCGEPFLTRDAKNKARVCDSQDYKRFKVVAGEFYKGAMTGKSTCYMANKAHLEKARRVEKKRALKIAQ
ncbi:hypothetical protein [Bacillus paranthracis]|uniref:hypothetical protein n=1 Tax=Bacillus paranthracis TaxID=2026186 RepID=UPI003D659296